MHSDRRRFFGWLGGASLLGAAGIPVDAARTASAPLRAPLVPVSDTWDVSWTDRVTGEHRAVFDSPEAAYGAALFRANAWCDHYKEVYGTDRQAMSPVVVFRHLAIDMVMDDAYWQYFRIGKALKIRDEKNKWAESNPISARSLPADSMQRRGRIETFIANGGIVLACGWAFAGIPVERYKATDKLDTEAATARAHEHLIPGVILQPNGIFAVLRAQEVGCHYVLSS